jgi:hypothetical protein
LAARRTTAIFTRKKAHSDALADLPAFDSFAKRLDAPHDFVTGYARLVSLTSVTLHSGAVGMAHTTGLDPDANLTVRRLWNRSFNQFQLAGRRDHRGSVA